MSLGIPGTLVGLTVLSWDIPLVAAPGRGHASEAGGQHLWREEVIPRSSAGKKNMEGGETALALGATIPQE